MNSAENFTAPSNATITSDGDTGAIRAAAAGPSKRGSIRALKSSANDAAGTSTYRRGLCP